MFFKKKHLQHFLCASVTLLSGCVSHRSKFKFGFGPDLSADEDGAQSLECVDMKALLGLCLLLISSSILIGPYVSRVLHKLLPSTFTFAFPTLIEALLVRASVFSCVS